MKNLLKFIVVGVSLFFLWDYYFFLPDQFYFLSEEGIGHFILFLTLIVLVYYTIETHKLRIEAAEQNRLSIEPFVVLVGFFGKTLRFRNAGRGFCNLTKIDIDGVSIGEDKLPLWLDANSSDSIPISTKELSKIYSHINNFKEEGKPSSRDKIILGEDNEILWMKITCSFETQLKEVKHTEMKCLLETSTSENDEFGFKVKRISLVD